MNIKQARDRAYSQALSTIAFERFTDKEIGHGTKFVLNEVDGEFCYDVKLQDETLFARLFLSKNDHSWFRIEIIEPS